MTARPDAFDPLALVPSMPASLVQCPWHPDGCADDVDNYEDEGLNATVWRVGYQCGCYIEAERRHEETRDSPNATQIAFVSEGPAVAMPTGVLISPLRADDPKLGPFRVVRLDVNVNWEHTVHLRSDREDAEVAWFRKPSCWDEFVRLHQTGETITAEQLRAMVT